MENGEAVFDATPKEFAKYVRDMVNKGAQVVGGCCGTSPEFIRKVREIMTGVKPFIVVNDRITTASSYSKTIVLGKGVKIIGERINPNISRKMLYNCCSYC